MSQEVFKRQTGMFDPSAYKDVEVVIVGTGGIGSAICVALAKMGMKKFVLYDHDKVEPHNISNQMFTKMDIGLDKVEAIKAIMHDMSPDDDDLEIKAVSKKFKKSTKVSRDSIVIMSVDSLKTRNDIYMAVGNQAQLVIDPRMGGNFMSVWSINQGMDPEVLGEYIETFNKPVAPLPCTMQAIAYTMNGCAAIVGSMIRNHLVGNRNPFHVMLELENFFLNSRFHEDIIDEEEWTEITTEIAAS